MKHLVRVGEAWLAISFFGTIFWCGLIFAAGRLQKHSPLPKPPAEPLKKDALLWLCPSCVEAAHMAEEDITDGVVCCQRCHHAETVDALLAMRHVIVLPLPVASA